MSLLVVGLSYRTAPLHLLERTALPAEAARGLEARAGRHRQRGRGAGPVDLQPARGLRRGRRSSTAAWPRSASRSRPPSGVLLGQLTDHLYVHYEGAAVAHLFPSPAGLDSMAVGEQQILGQVRAALRGAQEARHRRARARPAAADGAAGRQAGARRDRAGPGRALAGRGRAGPRGPGARAAARGPGPGGRGRRDERAGRGRPGAGPGVAQVAVANRTAERAAAAGRLGRWPGDRPGRPRRTRWPRPTSCCPAPAPPATWSRPTRSPGPGSAAGGRPQVYVDLAVPRDVDPGGRPAARRHRGRPGAAGPRPGRGRTGAAGLDDVRVDRRRGGRGVPGRPAGRVGGPDRGRAARARPRRGRGRAGPAGHAGSARSTSGSGPRWSRPCTGWSRNCCTLRPCG